MKHVIAALALVLLASTAAHANPFVVPDEETHDPVYTIDPPDPTPYWAS